MHDLNVLALLKGQERFVFVYDEGSRGGMIDAIRDAAADPGSVLSWFDAAVLVERARLQATRTTQEEDPSRMSFPSN